MLIQHKWLQTWITVHSTSHRSNIYQTRMWDLNKRDIRTRRIQKSVWVWDLLFDSEGTFISPLFYLLNMQLLVFDFSKVSILSKPNSYFECAVFEFYPTPQFACVYICLLTVWLICKVTGAVQPDAVVWSSFFRFRFARHKTFTAQRALPIIRQPLQSVECARVTKTNRPTSNLPINKNRQTQPHQPTYQLTPTN